MSLALIKLMIDFPSSCIETSSDLFFSCYSFLKTQNNSHLFAQKDAHSKNIIISFFDVLKRSHCLHLINKKLFKKLLTLDDQRVNQFISCVHTIILLNTKELTHSVFKKIIKKDRNLSFLQQFLEICQKSQRSDLITKKTLRLIVEDNPLIVLEVIEILLNKGTRLSFSQENLQEISYLQHDELVSLYSGLISLDENNLLGTISPSNLELFIAVPDLFPKLQKLLKTFSKEDLSFYLKDEYIHILFKYPYCFDGILHIINMFDHIDRLDLLHPAIWDFVLKTTAPPRVVCFIEACFFNKIDFLGETFFKRIKPFRRSFLSCLPSICFILNNLQNIVLYTFPLDDLMLFLSHQHSEDCLFPILDLFDKEDLLGYLSPELMQFLFESTSGELNEIYALLLALIGSESHFNKKLFFDHLRFLKKDADTLCSIIHFINLRLFHSSSVQLYSNLFINHRYSQDFYALIQYISQNKYYKSTINREILNSLVLAQNNTGPMLNILKKINIFAKSCYISPAVMVYLSMEAASLTHFFENEYEYNKKVESKIINMLPLLRCLIDLNIWPTTSQYSLFLEKSQAETLQILRLCELIMSVDASRLNMNLIIDFCEQTLEENHVLEQLIYEIFLNNKIIFSPFNNNHFQGPVLPAGCAVLDCLLKMTAQEHIYISAMLIIMNQDQQMMNSAGIQYYVLNAFFEKIITNQKITVQEFLEIRQFLNKPEYQHLLTPEIVCSFYSHMSPLSPIIYVLEALKKINKIDLIDGELFRKLLNMSMKHSFELITFLSDALGEDSALLSKQLLEYLICNMIDVTESSNYVQALRQQHNIEMSSEMLYYCLLHRIDIESFMIERDVLDSQKIEGLDKKDLTFNLLRYWPNINEFKKFDDFIQKRTPQITMNNVLFECMLQSEHSSQSLISIITHLLAHIDSSEDKDYSALSTDLLLNLFEFDQLNELLTVFEKLPIQMQSYDNLLKIRNCDQALLINWALTFMRTAQEIINLYISQQSFDNVISKGAPYLSNLTHFSLMLYQTGYRSISAEAINNVVLQDQQFYFHVYQLICNAASSPDGVWINDTYLQYFLDHQCGTNAVSYLLSHIRCSHLELFTQKYVLKFIAKLNDPQNSAALYYLFRLIIKNSFYISVLNVDIVDLLLDQNMVYTTLVYNLIYVDATQTVFNQEILFSLQEHSDHLEMIAPALCSLAEANAGLIDAHTCTFLLEKFASEQNVASWLSSYIYSQTPEYWFNNMMLSGKNIKTKSLSDLLRYFRINDAFYRGGAKSLTMQACSFALTVKAHPEHLLWIEPLAEYFLEGCVNQPVRGFSEISSWLYVASQEKNQDKFQALRYPFILDFIKRKMIEENTMVSVEVEKANALLREACAGLKECEAWPGIPEGIAYEGTISSWLVEKTELIECTRDKIKNCQAHDITHFLYRTDFMLTWGPIAFSTELKEIASKGQKKKDVMMELLNNVMSDPDFIFDPASESLLADDDSRYKSTDSLQDEAAHSSECIIEMLNNSYKKIEKQIDCEKYNFVVDQTNILAMNFQKDLVLSAIRSKHSIVFSKIRKKTEIQEAAFSSQFC